MKKFLLAICLILSIGLFPVYAQEENDQNKSQTTDIEISPKANDYISKCSVYIDALGNSTISIEAYTKTYLKVDSLKVNVYLQKYENSSWQTIKSWSDSILSADRLDFETKYTNAKSGKYRVKVIHTVTKNNKIENEESYSKEISIK